MTVYEWLCCCVGRNMTRHMPLWYDRDQALFIPVKKDHPSLEVAKVPGGSVTLSYLYGFL